MLKKNKDKEINVFMVVATYYIKDGHKNKNIVLIF